VASARGPPELDPFCAVRLMTSSVSGCTAEAFQALAAIQYLFEGELRANIKKRFALFRSNFTIASTEETYEVDGNIIGFEFSIKNRP
jgi:hypothetical protein